MLILFELTSFDIMHVFTIFEQLVNVSACAKYMKIIFWFIFCLLYQLLNLFNKFKLLKKYDNLVFSIWRGHVGYLSYLVLWVENSTGKCDRWSQIPGEDFIMLKFYLTLVYFKTVYTFLDLWSMFVYIKWINISLTNHQAMIINVHTNIATKLLYRTYFLTTHLTCHNQICYIWMKIVLFTVLAILWTSGVWFNELSTPMFSRLTLVPV